MGRFSSFTVLACVLSVSFAPGCSESARPTANEGSARPTANEGSARPTANEGLRPYGPDGAYPASSSAVSAVASSSAVSPDAAAPSVPAVPRIYSKSRFAWIQPAPRYSKGWLGYLSLGGSVALRGGSVEAARVAQSGGADGCEAWYAVEPQGYVCAGDRATLDAKDPVVVALAGNAPRLDSPWPFEYGESIGTPRYAKIPSEEEQQRKEPYLAGRDEAASTKKQPDENAWAGLERWSASSTENGVEALLPFSPLVREDRSWIVPGSTVAYTRSLEVGGRAFLLTSDKALVPKDRVRPYPRSTFHGVKLGGEVNLPIAFFRKSSFPQYKKTDKGEFVEAGERWPRLAWVMLTGEKEKIGSDEFYATREPGRFVRARDATIVRAAKRTLPPKAGRRTWIEVSVLGGWLVAYEGETPVFTTLISPGRGGIPYEDRDPLETASTPTGRFRVDGKFVTATMVSSTNDDIVHSEVQFVLNFHGPHALHGAYWHDAWGELKSGGCVNLSPMDARWLFGWTEPELPAGWHGMRAVPSQGPSTAVVVHR